jgi:putative transposase
MSYIGGKGKSNKIIKLTNKRNNKIKHYLHCASKYVLNYCLTNDISKVIIGNNKNWKQGVNIGKRNNQNFVSIPYSTLIEQLKYKCLLNGIEVVVTEESYTSKCSFVHSEPMEHKQKYLGNRIKRGVYKVGNLCYNADVNGALNIIRKVVPTFSIRDYGIEGVVVHPIKVTL